MVPIPAGDAIPGWPFRVFAAPGVPLPDYLIGRSETTNEDYKRFVDAGGYQNPSFWKEPFIKDGRELSWEEALSHFRDRTSRPGPATWEVGSFPKGQETNPVSGVSWFEAAAYAEYAGKSLPTVYHWTRAAQTHMAPLILPGSNFRGTGTAPVGRPGTLSGFGTTDMAGNVKEWCWNEASSGRRFLLGGGFGDPTYMFNQTDAQSPWERRPNYGFRSVRLATPPTEAMLAKLERTLRDFSSEKPVSEEVFRAFRGLYAYDRTDLNARVEDTEKTERWTRETVHLDAAYGNERLTVHLYLPTNAKPPFQVVLHCTGANAFLAGEFDPSSIEDWGSDYIMESGRALAFPIVKGMFERKSDLRPGGPGGNPPALWRDHLIAISKDLGRTLDYLETRQELDLDRVAYQGFSWGGSVAPVLLAVEDRIRVAILFSSGLWMDRPLPEADPFLFAPYVRIPTVMLSDRYDALFSVESSQLPFFRALGTAEEDKRRVIYETGHGSVPRTEEIRETLDWLDKYLGVVGRK
jgi:predicted esterase